MQFLRNINTPAIETVSENRDETLVNKVENANVDNNKSYTGIILIALIVVFIIAANNNSSNDENTDLADSVGADNIT